MIKRREVIDITDMPEAIKSFTYELYSDRIVGNGSYIEHEVLSETYLEEQDDGTETEEKCEEYSILDEYLVSCGARVGSWIIILYWW